jgi:stalled ribosome rescue protein Dom34
LKGHYHAVVWIDHREARVFHFNADEVEKTVIHPEHSDTERRKEKHTGHPSADNTHFLEAVTQAIADAGAIMVTGPGAEKLELMKHIERSQPRLKGAVEALEAADHATDGALVDHARKVLSAADRMRPQR